MANNIDKQNISVLVFGATGNQGGAVSRALLNSGFQVRALTRNKESEKAKTLENLGATLVEGDLKDPKSLENAARGARYAFIVSMVSQDEKSEGILAVQQMVNAGVKHIVFSSVANADLKTGIPHFESKRAVEEYLENENINHTVIGPAFFMENLFAPWNLPSLINGQFAQPLTPDKPLQFLAAEDIGKFTALILENPSKFNNRRIDLAGDSLTSTQLTGLLSATVNRKIEYIPLEKTSIQMDEMRIMFEWLEDIGYSVDIKNLKQTYPEVNFLTLETWLDTQNLSQFSQETQAGKISNQF